MSSDHSQQSVPSRTELMNPALRALHSLGGRATINEMHDQVVKDMGLSARAAITRHTDGKQSKLSYELGWTRTFLKKYGLINNLKPGIWTLTELGQSTETVDAGDVIHRTNARRFQESSKTRVAEQSVDYSGGDPHWQSELLELLRVMDPSAFERLCQEILSESGFIEVEVTGRSSDGGIDGHGFIRLAGLISFPVVFQCKRYKGSVGAPTIRDFRGAMQGRADKGLIMTTGQFTAEAHGEATRDGAPPIDLIDGGLLVNKIKELGLGVTTRTVEVVEVDAGWFETV